MIEYLLKDKDSNTYSLNGSLVSVPLKATWSQGSDVFSYDNKIVERSFLPGALLVGEKRLMSRNFTMLLNSARPSDNDFQVDINELLMWLNKTKYLVDVTNNMQIEITVKEIEIEYDQGSLKHSSNNRFYFTALTPFWSSLTEDEVSGSAVSDVIKEINVSNDGYLKVHPVITLTAAIATDDVQLYINSSNTGIQIQDSLFGTSGNLVMEIDCEKGLVSIGDVNRNVSIVPGTGFFDLPIGSDVINLLSSESITYSIKWKKRYYI